MSDDSYIEPIRGELEVFEDPHQDNPRRTGIIFRTQQGSDVYWNDPDDREPELITDRNGLADGDEIFFDHFTGVGVGTVRGDRDGGFRFESGGSVGLLGWSEENPDIVPNHWVCSCLIDKSVLERTKS